MKLPVIKHLTQFIEDNDEDFVVETIETLEALTEVPSLKDEVRKFQKTILSFQDRCVEPNVLIQLNTQLFPLTLLN